MKLKQNMSPSRTYLGVTFPKGVTVTLPPDFPPDQAQHLLDWGWERVDKPEIAEPPPHMDNPDTEAVEAEAAIKSETESDS